MNGKSLKPGDKVVVDFGKELGFKTLTVMNNNRHRESLKFQETYYTKKWFDGDEIYKEGFVADTPLHYSSEYSKIIMIVDNEQ